MTAPQTIGNIISPAWLAAQMGLPVAEVQERLERARKEDECLATTAVPTTQTW